MNLSFRVAFIIGILCSQLSWAQGGIEPKFFEVITDIPVRKYDFDRDSAFKKESYILIPIKSRFVLVDESDTGFVIIRFVAWKESLEGIEKYRDAVAVRVKGDSLRANEYFALKKALLNTNCVRIYLAGPSTVKIAVGFVTMPVKLRLGENYEFEPTISLGATAGAKMRISKHYPNFLNLLFGASTSTVTIDSFSTSGRIRESIKNILVFSASLGLVVEFSKAQIGLFYGNDFMGKSNNVKYGWIYHKQPWVTLGFGFTLFTLDDKSEKPARSDTLNN